MKLFVFISYLLSYIITIITTTNTAATAKATATAVLTAAAQCQIYARRGPDAKCGHCGPPFLLESRL